MLALYGVTQVKHDNNPRSVLLRSDRRRFLAHHRFLDRYPALENQVFRLAETPRLTTKPVLEALRNLHLELLSALAATLVLMPALIFVASGRGLGDQTRSGMRT